MDCQKCYCFQLEIFTVVHSYKYFSSFWYHLEFYMSHDVGNNPKIHDKFSTLTTRYHHERQKWNWWLQAPCVIWASYSSVQKHFHGYVSRFFIEHQLITLQAKRVTFKLSFLNWNLALTLGCLNPALNNPALDCIIIHTRFTLYIVCLFSFFSGFINATVTIHNSVPVGAMMFVAGGMFLIGVIVDIFLLLKVCLLYNRAS